MEEEVDVLGSPSLIVLRVSVTIKQHRNKLRVQVRRFGLAVIKGVRLISGRTSVRFRFGSPFSSKRLWFVDIIL